MKINTYTYKNLSLKKTLIITLLFFIVSFIGAYFHELWMDESHHFLLGRDSAGFLDLFNNTRYDGHPILWNYLVHLVTKFSTNPFYMQLLHISISSTIAFIFLKKAPFQLWFKIAFLLGYFMLYEYTIISRNYNLGILFLFLSCVLYAKKDEKFSTFCLFLALSCNTHSIFTIVTCSLVVNIFLIHFKEYKFALFKKFWKGYVIFFIGFVLAFYQIVPKSDSIFFSKINYTFYQSLKSITSLFKALVPVVDFTEVGYWNQFYFINHFKIMALFFGCISFSIPLLLFNKHKNILRFVYLTFGGFIAFEILTQRFGIRYNGLLFITIIIGLWMQYSDKEKPFLSLNLSKYNSKIVLIIMIFQVVGGILVYSLDIKKTFNHGKNMANYIIDQKIEINTIVTACESASINSYLNDNLYNLYYQKKQGYYLWNAEFSEFYNKSQSELIELGFRVKPNKNSLYFILNDALKTENISKKMEQTYLITLVRKFDGAVENNYYLYLIKKNE